MASKALRKLNATDVGPLVVSRQHLWLRLQRQRLAAEVTWPRCAATHLEAPN